MAGFEDHSEEISTRMQGNVANALRAMGVKAVGLTVDKMQTGYHDPHPTRNRHGEIIGSHTAIRDTGELQRDVNFEVDAAKRVVTVGNSLEYAPFVHDGTRKLRGRPYLTDAISEGGEKLQRVAEAELKRGME